MIATASGDSLTTMLKREDCNRTKHDSDFSDWKVLVGPSDWEDHSLGKEGAARYRVHNLPKNSGPGIYELGIAVSQAGLGREVGKLDPDRLVVVYLGQADNVRTRLQQYGRTGAHLGNSYANGCANDSKNVSLQKRPGLFNEILSRGYPIVFRWAPMESKRDAEKTEDKLLIRFDYAWNTHSNGARRRDDILQKLNKIDSGTTRYPNMVRKLLPFSQKQVGIRIKASKLPSPENKLNTYADLESYNFLSRVFKFGRSQPRLVLDRIGVIEDNTSFCGVPLGDGSVCRRPPLERRKRRAEHRGMRINMSIPKVVAECPVSESFTPICGVPLNNGSPCVRQPAKGRKRCDDDVDLDSSCHDALSYNQNSSAMCKPGIVQPRVSLEKLVVSKKGYETICGVELGSGAYCTRQPARGRVRCEEHKSLKVNGLVSKLEAEDKSHVSGLGSKLSTYNDYKYGNSTTCGATCRDGSLCRRKLVEGNKRCWQHGGISAGSSFSGFDSGINSLTCSKLSTYNDYKYGNSTTCGATCHDGSLCRRQPVEGNKRCWQHKGMKAGRSFYF
nr:protein EFFECTOR OF TRANSCRIPTION 2-like [Quercus suber]POF18384.1 protein effector of transcription 2 [Quercus suber]